MPSRFQVSWMRQCYQNVTITFAKIIPLRWHAHSWQSDLSLSMYGFLRLTVTSERSMPKEVQIYRKGTQHLLGR